MPEVYFQKICVGNSDWELRFLCLGFFGGRGPRVEDPWCRIWVCPIVWEIKKNIM